MKKLPMLGLLGSVALTGCVSNADMGINNDQWRLLNDKQKQNFTAHYRENKDFQKHRQYQPGPTRITVRIRNGTANVTPSFDASRFYATKFQLRDGQCKRVPLIAVQKSGQANLTACFTNQVLSLDPSRYKVKDREGTLFLNYNPVWLHGFTYYGVSSSGYAGLSGVDITVNSMVSKAQRR